MFGVTHGALQFMTYEEMKAFYNRYRKLPYDNKLVSFCLVCFAKLPAEFGFLVRSNDGFNKFWRVPRNFRAGQK